MPAKRPAHKPPTRGLAPSPEITPADRAYYREAWGFDPVMECIHLRGGHYRYETGFPLDHDPGLDAAGVRVAARVDFSSKGEIHNRIVFWRVNQEALVECTHTVAYAGPAQDALTLGDDSLVRDGFLARDVQAMVKRAGGPVTLPPWEHFAALKSYVAAVAEAGVGNMLRAAWAVDHEKGMRQEEVVPVLQLPFGFNSEMQAQVLRAIVDVAPAAGRSLVVEWGCELLDTAPVAWLAEQLGLLNKLTDNASSASRLEDDHPEVLKPVQELLLAWLGDRLATMAPDWWEPRRRFLYDITKAAFPFPYLEPQDIGHVDGLVPFERYGKGAALQALVRRYGRDWAIAHREQVFAAFGDSKDVREWVVPAITWRGRPIPVNDGKVELRGIADLREVDFGAVAGEIRELDLSGGRIAKIENLDALINLEKLDLSQNAIQKIEGLEHLINLQELKLWGNKISEIHILQSNKQLTWLNLSRNQIQVINNLESLKNLKNLDLGYNLIRKIENIESLVELEYLDLQHNTIEKIENLHNSTKLQSLILAGNNIRRIEGLESLVNLRSLVVGWGFGWGPAEGNHIFKIEGLNSQKNLQRLLLGNNQLIGVNGIECLKELKELDLAGNRITNIAGLDTLKNLVELVLSENQIENLSGLEHLDHIEKIRIDHNQIKNFDGSCLPAGLREIWIEDNKIIEVKRLERLQELLSLNLSRNQLKEIDALVSLRCLETLYLTANPVSRVEGLANLISLKVLSLSHTRVEDLGPLANLKNLVALYLQGLHLTSLSPLGKLDKLETLDLQGVVVQYKEGQDALTKIKGPDGRRALLALSRGN